jgi:hypothetical protein
MNTTINNKLQPSFENISDETRRAINTIKIVVAAYYEVPIRTFDSTRRLQEVVRAKQTAAYFIKLVLPKLTLRTIGSQLQYTHCDVIYALKTVKTQIEVNGMARADILKITQMLRNSDLGIEFNGIETQEYINLDNCISVKLKNGKSMVFSSFTAQEVNDFVKNNPETMRTAKVSHHTKTNIFLLNKQTKN